MLLQKLHKRAPPPNSLLLLQTPQAWRCCCSANTLRNNNHRPILLPSSRNLFTKTKVRPQPKRTMSFSSSSVLGAATVLVLAGLTYTLYQHDYVQPLPATKNRDQIRAERKKWAKIEARKEKVAEENAKELSELPYGLDKEKSAGADDNSAWGVFSTKFAVFSTVADLQWGTKIAEFLLPDWALVLPENINKLQKELSMAPGSLADDIWQEAHDTFINPEIEWSASVRVSTDLCDEEKDFLRKRRVMTTAALAKYLGIPEEDIHPDDVPTIAMVGSGGGLRALVAGAGSLLAAKEDGLFDCVTYTAGVSGACWLQALYNSSLSGHQLDRLVDHLKARIGTHIAYPPVALAALNSAPTNKFLLSGFVEKLKGDPNAEVGLVDLYGLLLAARLLVPKGEIGVNEHDLKISNQREHLKNGEQPMPIYTAVRHEIPILEEASATVAASAEGPSEKSKEVAKKEAWFQWFEITPYEMFCEEFAAGIPTWSIGRKFENGQDLPHDENGLRLPEMRLSLLLGVFGSAFCATLSHYYREIKPLVKLAGFANLDNLIEGRNDDLSKVHPIAPVSFPNFAYKMEGMLPETAPESIYKTPHLQLMDAGMSNNLPIYPLLRPGRDIDILIAFDASADIKTENWLSVADGYAKQRGIKGWPIGSGWPKKSDSPEKTGQQLDEAQAQTAEEADEKVETAKADQVEHIKDLVKEGASAAQKGMTSEDAEDADDDLGHCTVWVGTTEERSSTTEDVTSKAVKEDWQLMEPDAGIAVVYFPFMKNAKVEGVDPVTCDYMSTWNFVYTPEDVDSVVKLAQANYEEGRDQTRRCVRAVYERKKKKRLEREKVEKEERYRRKVRLGIVGKKGEGDHFHLT